MHLPPRQFKRRKFSCVQCGLCVQACEHSQSAQQREPLLQWSIGVDALRESLRARPRETPSPPAQHAASNAASNATEH